MKNQIQQIDSWLVKDQDSEILSTRDDEHCFYKTPNNSAKI